MNDIDVSFFVPVYRPPRLWMNEMVDSMLRLFQQTHLKVELLLGDDGSPEHSADFIDEYAQRYPEYIRVIHYPVNRGIGITSCALVTETKGRYIASFDQDDIILPFNLNQEISFLDEHPEYCASYAQKYLFNGNGFTGEVHGDILSAFQAFFSPKININAMLIRREVLFAKELFKPVPYTKVLHDVWLMLRLAEDSLIYFSRTPRALYRVHGDQTSTQTNDRKDWWLILQDMICRHGELYRKIILEPELPAGKTPMESRLIDSLTGAAFFMNQGNPSLSDHLLLKALQRYPEDFGIYEIILHVAAKRNFRNDFLKYYDIAMRRFAANEDARRIFANLAVLSAKNAGISDPNLQIMAYSLWQKRATPTPEAIQALQRLKLSLKQ